MKKLLCCLLLAGALCCAGNVQATTDYGVKAGLAFSDQKFTYYGSLLEYKPDWRTGVTAGVFVERTMLPYAGVRLEALYVQKGHQIDIATVDEHGTDGPMRTFHHRVDILSLNLLAKGFLPSGTYVLAGPRLDMKLGTAGDFESDPGFQSIEADYSSVVPGITAGIGQEFRITRFSTMFVEGQYHLDVDKMLTRSFDATGESGLLKSIENRSLTVFLGVRF